MRMRYRQQSGRGTAASLGSLGAALLILALATPAGAIDFPGSTWGQLTHDVDRLSGSGTMGYINQGIDWTTLPGGFKFNTFAEFRYRLRSLNNEFFNAYGPAIGLQFKKSYFKFGMDYYWERYPMLSESTNKLQYFVNWYYDWNLKRP